jgi:hypothetical protein
MTDEKREKALQHMRRQYSKTATAAREHGWEISHELAETQLAPGVGPTYDRLDVTVKRGQENITIWWQDGKLLEAPNYLFAGDLTKLRNHSAMLKQMASKPDPLKAKKRLERASRRSGQEYDLVEVIRDLPFEPDELDDGTLLRLCYGKTLTWRNSITGGVEIDGVKADLENPKSGPNWNKINYKVTRSSAGRRVIQFVGHSGYRAVGVDALLRVG